MLAAIPDLSSPVSLNRLTAKIVTVHAPLSGSVQCVIKSVELERFVSASVRDIPPVPLPQEATTRSPLGSPYQPAASARATGAST